MADPISATTLITVASTAITGIGGFVAMQQQAKINEYNARVMDENARAAQERSAVEAQEQDFATRGFLGQQLAAQAGSGVDIGTGSPTYTRIAARDLGRLDALNIRQAGELEARNYRQQAVGYRNQAGLNRMEGAFGLLGSFLDAGSAITNAKPVAKKNYYIGTAYPQRTVLR